MLRRLFLIHLIKLCKMCVGCFCHFSLFDGLIPCSLGGSLLLRFFSCCFCHFCRFFNLSLGLSQCLRKISFKGCCCFLFVSQGLLPLLSTSLRRYIQRAEVLIIRIRMMIRIKGHCFHSNCLG